MTRLYSLVPVLLAAAAIVHAQRRPLDSDALARLREDEPRRLRFIQESLAAARSRLGLTGSHTLELRGLLTDQYGRLHARYRQLYKGVRFLSGGLIAHLDEQDRFLDPTTKLFTTIDLDVTPAVDASAARAAVALRITSEEAPPSTIEPALTSELVVVPERALTYTEDVSMRVIAAVPSMAEYQWTTTRYTLAYLVLSSTAESAADDREPEAWLVDAMTGVILRRYSLRADDSARQTARGTARSFFHGQVDLATALNPGTLLYELNDPARGGNSVLNLNHSASTKRSKASAFTSSSNSWGDGQRYSQASGTTSPNGQTLAADVAFALEKSWDLLHNVFGHRGLDARGAPIEARVHFGSGRDDAFWHRTARAVFFGSGSAGSQPPADLETVAHEVGHGVWYALIEHEGGADSEADGISQGSADIFASLVEYYHLGARGRGATLPDVSAPWNWRPRMVNPAATIFRPVGGAPQPGLVYWTANAPVQEEHAVGALYGHLFVLLASGASATPGTPLASRFFANGTAGVGVQAAAEVWYVATTAYLPDEPNFFELRQAYLQAAAFLHGETSAVYNSVLNAFAAVGLGSPAMDSSVPAVNQITIQTLDEAEGSLLAAAGASDDTGVLRVEFLLDNNLALVRAKAPYSGYLDIAGLAAGPHTLTVRALDYLNNVGFSRQPFVLKGVNQSITDGGFESGGTRWNATAGVIRSGGAGPFLGSRYAAFDGSASLSQAVTIGGAATEATLAFRLRIENPGGFATGARLELQIRDAQGNLLDTLNTWYDSLETLDTLANNYSRQTYSLTAYKGRPIELRWLSTGPPGAARFSLDNVSVTSSGPPGVETAAEVDDGDGSIIFRLRNLTGLRPAQIARVDYLVDGELMASSSADPFLVVLPTQGITKRAHSLVAALYDLAGQKLIESAPSAFVLLTTVNQLAVNGGFESGGLNWVTTGQTTFGRDNDTVQRAFLGTRYAFLGGKGAAHTDELAQSILIPAEAVGVTLTFRIRIDSQERTPADTLAVRLFDERGALLADLARFDSLTSTRGADSAKGYIKRTFDLSAHAGKRILLHFQGRENTGAPTSFFLDNVSLTWREQ